MNSDFMIYGQLYKIGKDRQVSDKFKIREFAIKTFGRYEQKIKFQLTQDRTDALDMFSVGDKVTVHFDIVGNETTEGKIFNNLNAWKLVPDGEQLPEPAPQSKKAAPMAVPVDDELPF